MNKIKHTLSFVFPLLGASSLFALTASDNADNYSGSGWTNGSNQGSGFLDWSLNNNNDPDGDPAIFAGNFIDDSTAGAGDINTNGNSFGMFANPGPAFSTAIRSFGSALTANDQFSFQMALNFDDGNKGFNLRTAGDSIFNFNVGGGGSVSSPKASTTLIAGSGMGYNYGGNDAVIDVVLLITSATSLDYEITRSSSEGFQGTLFSGSVEGITGSIDNFEFYVSGTTGGDQNNLYFNNLSVTAVPEPGAYALLAGCTAMLWLALRRRSSPALTVGE